MLYVCLPPQVDDEGNTMDENVIPSTFQSPVQISVLFIGCDTVYHLFCWATLRKVNVLGTVVRVWVGESMTQLPTPAWLAPSQFWNGPSGIKNPEPMELSPPPTRLSSPLLDYFDIFWEKVIGPHSTGANGVSVCCVSCGSCLVPRVRVRSVQHFHWCFVWRPVCPHQPRIGIRPELRGRIAIHLMTIRFVAQDECQWTIRIHPVAINTGLGTNWILLSIQNSSKLQFLPNFCACLVPSRRRKAELGFKSGTNFLGMGQALRKCKWPVSVWCCTFLASSLCCL